MNTSAVFIDFCNNLKISNKEEISNRYRRITKKLNQKYYESNSEIKNSLQVGSYGRGTGVDGISDLDMVFELPWDIYNKYDNYETNGQSALLQDVKKCIKETYPNTEIRGDGQVVVVKFNNYAIEVVPGFLDNDDKSYIYPDSNDGGKWKVTKPRAEIEAINNFDTNMNGNLKRLCQMIRAWRNKHGINMCGLLIDTFCFNFFKETDYYNDKSYSKYDIMVRDFFKYLKTEDDEQKFWYAFGSNQKVYKGDKFTKNAKKAYNLSLEAIEKEENNTVYSIWRDIFGTMFPYYTREEKIAEAKKFTDTEQFIEDFFKVDIRYSLKIDCKVKQEGFRKKLLSKLSFLKRGERLRFFIKYHNVPTPYEVKWKVRNLGKEAIRRDSIRGKILDDMGNEERIESSDFKGNHYVECFIIKNNTCVARDKIEVPILITKN